jgi:hypothetical protein
MLALYAYRDGRVVVQAGLAGEQRQRGKPGKRACMPTACGVP